MIYVGTSGYSYKDWIGPFYPEDVKQGDMLSIYSGAFDFTEINSTYYRLPNAFMFYNMQKKTGDAFKFTVKLHQAMTHSRDASPADYRTFLDSVKVLKEANKLGCLVAQFPYSFHCDPGNRDYLKALKEQLEGYELVVEFRNNKWINDSTFELLKENELGFVCVDEPSLYGLLDRKALSTSKISYVRLHGRNSRKWWEHEEAYERYDYLYKESELAEWVEKVEKLAEDCEDCFVSFNNHYKAQAVSNAMLLKKLLGLE